MVKKVEFKWEQLDENTKRVKVMSGWLIVHCTKGTKNNFTESMVFLADQHWEWQVLPPIEDPEVKKKNLANDFKA